MSPRLRRWLVRIHLLLGLAVAPYLLIYGVSTWLLNRDGVPETGPVRTREAAIDVPLGEDPVAGAEAVRAALGLAGHLPPWRVETHGEGALSFAVNRPGRLYEVHYAPASGRARVEARSTGLVGVVKGLHGLNVLPGSRWARSWALYTELSVVGLAVLVASGLWLDARRWRRRSRAALGLVAAGAGYAAAVVWLAAP